jgi:hypothetical protein
MSGKYTFGGPLRVLVGLGVRVAGLPVGVSVGGPPGVVVTLAVCVTVGVSDGTAVLLGVGVMVAVPDAVGDTVGVTVASSSK